MASFNVNQIGWNNQLLREIVLDLFARRPVPFINCHVSSFKYHFLNFIICHFFLIIDI